MRYRAPFVFKLSFYLPDRPGSAGKNSAHVRYIATRPGVDLGHDLDKPKQVPDLGGSERPVPGTAAHHVGYAHERPNSHGLFSSGEDEVELDEIQKELLEHKGIAWRLILSLHEDDATRLEMLNRQAWEETIKQNMPEMTELMGIQPSNLRWVAAYHPEAGHPHAHVIFWEKHPKRRKGVVTKELQRKMKRVFVNKIYAADRDLLTKEKTVKRDAMRQLGISSLREAVDFSRTWNRQWKEAKQLHDLSDRTEEMLSPRLENDQRDYLVQKLKSIQAELPGKGRLMLKFMPDSVKRQVSEVAAWMYQQPQFNPLRHAYEEASGALAEPYSSQAEQRDEAVSKAKADMLERFSQTILKAAYEIGQHGHVEIDLNRAERAVWTIQGATGRVDSLNERLALKVLHDCHELGLTKEDCADVIARLKLPPIPNWRIEKEYETECDHALTYTGAHMLRLAYGDDGIKDVMNRLNYTTADLEQYGREQVTAKPEELARFYGERDVLAGTVGQMATLLLSTRSPEEAEQIIQDWSLRTGSDIDPDKIKQIVQRKHEEFQETAAWGRTPLLSVKDYRQLCKRLNIDDSSYPWKTRDGREADPSKQSRRERASRRGIESSIAQGVMKSALKQISAGIRRNEAEIDRQHQKLLDRISRNVERDEQERDRKSKESRGR
ncbi:hypothetical protein B8V81_5070 [Paenibacillus pasadenensis]|uniref:Uncharacterized protein n=1 Tax=Paenibacillus pasadenensis TaxID=217090 RepID=A0A2N5MZL6_9BACL|nr:MobP3 family relaxase [Paenibacillus pasadenensis]PLT43530.1 hypothetical protein B8V81_5070 [Paenibacillus pasadenensis]